MFNPNVHNIEDVRKALQNMDSGGWRSWTFAWTGAGGNPTLSSHTISNYYQKINGWCLASFAIVFGAANYGSGDYTFTLPITSKAGPRNLGTALIYDASGTVYYDGTVLMPAGGRTCQILVTNTVAGQRIFCAHNVPVTFATSDQISATIVYPI